MASGFGVYGPRVIGFHVFRFLGYRVTGFGAYVYWVLGLLNFGFRELYVGF